MFKYIKNDLPSSIVLYFVALASGSPLFSRFIAGFIGGILVGSLSDSTVGASGPAVVIGQIEVWIIAFTLALVASLVTVLSLEATDKLDLYKRLTSTNREWTTQGTGNIVSDLNGSLPITQMTVRSSANVHSGVKSKLSAIFYGFLIIISVILIFKSLNMIPLYGLATVLLLEGKSYQNSHFLHQLDINRNSA